MPETIPEPESPDQWEDDWEEQWEDEIEREAEELAETITMWSNIAAGSIAIIIGVIVLRVQKKKNEKLKSDYSDPY